MIESVIKSDGSEEPFNETKLKMSIQEAARDAGFSEGEAVDLVEGVYSSVMTSLVDDKKSVSTEDLREEVLETLDDENPDVAKAWRDYEEEMGKV